MSELGVNSCTGYSPSLIKQAHFPGLRRCCSLTSLVPSAGRAPAYKATPSCLGQRTEESFHCSSPSSISVTALKVVQCLECVSLYRFDGVSPSQTHTLTHARHFIWLVLLSALSELVIQPVCSYQRAVIWNDTQQQMSNYFSAWVNRKSIISL